MVPGPVQAAAIAAWGDQDHVDAQRGRYLERLALGIELFASLGIDASMPAGGFYLWVAAPDGDAWGLARRLAESAGVIVSPGEFYGTVSSGHVRLAVVQPTERLQLASDRLV
jgi:aspartate/methionine/tyrosine aminotransferase